MCCLMKNIFTVLSITAIILSAGPAVADTVVQHSGATDPGTEGFSAYSTPGYAVINDQGSGIDAWHMDGAWSTTQEIYYFSGANSGALSGGWALSAKLRNTSTETGDETGPWISVMLGGKRFDIGLHSDGNGDQVLTGNVNYDTTNYTISGLGQNYVYVQVAYDSVKGTADYYVNGSKVITGFIPTDQYFYDGLVWGGEGNFNLVKLETGNPWPSVTLSTTAPDPTNSSPIPVTITFSEPVTGFSVAGVTVTNGTLSAFSGSGASYSVNVTPAANGIVTVNVPAGVAVDADGNGNTAATPLSRNYQYAAPTANAGGNVSVDCESVANTVIHGTATDQDLSATLTYRWQEGQTVLLDWTPVGQSGDCPLALDTVMPPLQDGAHTLTLEVTDGQTIVTDNMTLTITNSAFLVLHSFAGGAGDGSAPEYTSLTPVGGVFYGMTPNGGANGKGVIFKFDPAAKILTPLHSFTGAAGDGDSPMGSLTLAGTTLYGMTSAGGAKGKGTIFIYDTTKVKTDGFTLLYSLGASGEGVNPGGSLTFVGKTLYGMTPNGGANGNGTIFKFDPAKKNLTVLHNFTGTAGDGASPQGSFILMGTTLYGMTKGGGSDSSGIIFKYNTNAKSDGFTVLHSFTGAADDGASPEGSFILMGTTLYGMTSTGGANGKGTIFNYNTKVPGDGFTLLHSFDSTNGGNPNSDLILLGTTLCGMTSSGGYSGYGTIFGYDTNASGDGFTLLHTFDSIGGSAPYGSITVFGTTLYGMTSGGGDSGLGVIFSYVPDFTISGAVKSSAGHPIAKVTVALKGASGLSAAAQTDTSGAYSFTDLLDGTYTLTPNLPGWKFSPSQVKTAIKDQNAKIQNFTGTPVTIKGTVTLYKGKNIPSGLTVMVKLADGEGNPVSSTSTNSSGGYEFDGVDGQYTVTPVPPNHANGGLAFVPPSANITVHGKNTTANFKLQTGASCKQCH